MRSRQKTGIRYIWGIPAVLFGIIMVSGISEGETVVASGPSGSFSSRGIIRYEQAVMDAADLQGIHDHVIEKKNAAAGVLQQIGTKFRQQEGGIVFDRDPDTAQGDIDLSQLGWAVIVQAAADSQKIPEGMSVLNPEAAMHIEGVGESTEHYVPASADNISRGKAAWVDGILLLGNGADNDKAYQAGIRDGGEGRVPEFLYPLYEVQEASVEIRHVHIGNMEEEEEGISGCYHNYKETKTKTDTCGAELIKTDATWYPNPEEPDGGSWHGGFYTCPYHSGVYESSGKCTYSKKVTTTIWHHECVCGLEDAVYARLRIGGADTDRTDRAIRLEAVLEEGDAYEQLAWQSEDRMIWSDEAGNVLGTMQNLDVQAPGTYRCGINVSNEDIDNKEISVTVRVSGVVLGN